VPDWTWEKREEEEVRMQRRELLSQQTTCSFLIFILQMVAWETILKQRQEEERARLPLKRIRDLERTRFGNERGETQAHPSQRLGPVDHGTSVSRFGPSNGPNDLRVAVFPLGEIYYSRTTSTVQGFALNALESVVHVSTASYGITIE
jgi:hypothetical protein